MKKTLFSVSFAAVLILVACISMAAGATGAQDPEAETMAAFFGVNAVVADNPPDMAPFATWLRDYTSWEWFEPEQPAHVHQCHGRVPSTPITRYAMKSALMSSCAFSAALSGSAAILSTPSTMALHLQGDAPGLSPEDYREAAEFYFQLAARYGSVAHPAESLLTADKKSGLGLVDAIEVMNEADGDASWGHHMTLEQYAALLNAVYDGDQGRLGPGYGIKTADPNMLVSITGVSYGVESLKKITEAAGRAPYDIVNIHHYCWVFDQRWSKWIGVAPEWGGLEKLIRDTVAWRDEAAPGKPIWLTELGWDTLPSDATQAVTEQDAANFLIRCMILSKYAGADKVFWFYYKDTDDHAEGQFSTSGIYRNQTMLNPEPPPKLMPKLTYWYFATLKNLLGPTVYQGRVDAGNETIYHFEFKHTDGGQTISVLWYCPVYNPRARVAPPSQVPYEFEVGQSQDRVRVVRPAAGTVEGETVTANWTGEKTLSLELTGTPVFVIVDQI